MELCIFLFNLAWTFCQQIGDIWARKCAFLLFATYLSTIGIKLVKACLIRCTYHMLSMIFAVYNSVTLIRQGFKFVPLAFSLEWKLPVWLAAPANQQEKLGNS